MSKTNLIDTAEYDRLSKLNQAFEAWLNTKRSRNGWASYKPEEVPAELRGFGNDERAKLELYAWHRDKPEWYFAYYAGEAERGARITNFTGELLGTVTQAGRVWTGKRRAVTVAGTNGCTYKGTAQLSNGTYVRLRAVKA